MADIVDSGTVDTIGFLAGALTTLSFLPQVIKVLRTRNTRSLSLLMYMLFSLGVLIWLVYGLLIRSTPIIFYNAVTLVLSVVLLVAKVRWG